MVEIRLPLSNGGTLVLAEVAVGELDVTLVDHDGTTAGELILDGDAAQHLLFFQD